VPSGYVFLSGFSVLWSDGKITLRRGGDVRAPLALLLLPLPPPPLLLLVVVVVVVVVTPPKDRLRRAGWARSVGAAHARRAVKLRLWAAACVGSEQQGGGGKGAPAEGKLCRQHH
jgi:hypothetical protein